MNTRQIIAEYKNNIDTLYPLYKKIYFIYIIIIILYFSFGFQFIKYSEIMTIKLFFTIFIPMLLYLLVLRYLAYKTKVYQSKKILKKYNMHTKLSYFNFKNYENILLYLEEIEVKAFLHKLGIKSNQQLQVLIKNIKNRYIRNFYLIISIFSALFIPVWYHLTGKHIMNSSENCLNILFEYLILIGLIGFFIIIFKYIINDFRMILCNPKKVMIYRLLLILEDIVID